MILSPNPKLTRAIISPACFDHNKTTGSRLEEKYSVQTLILSKHIWAEMGLSKLCFVFYTLLNVPNTGIFNIYSNNFHRICVQLINLCCCQGWSELCSSKLKVRLKMMWIRHGKWSRFWSYYLKDKWPNLTNKFKNYISLFTL